MTRRPACPILNGMSNAREVKAPYVRHEDSDGVEIHHEGVICRICCDEPSDDLTGRQERQMSEHFESGFSL